MASHIPFGSKSLGQVAKGHVAIHAMIRAGTDESLEAELVRDSLDSPYKVLTAVERERARWLSEDLYSISDPPDVDAPKELNSQAQQQLTEAIEARQKREWDRALLLLRQAQKSLAPALLSYLRGSIWLEAGHPHVAAEFFRHASECDPANPNYRALSLYALAKSDPDAADGEARRILADGGAHAIQAVNR